MKITKNKLMFVILIVVFFLRFWQSLKTYNGDIDNHKAWMQSVEKEGWQGLYNRDMGDRAPVNYPPLVLYTFWVGEKMFDEVPLRWQTEKLQASMYKFPSLLADCLVAWLIWRYTKFSAKMRLFMMAVYLLNPALTYNSISWGQVEALVTFFCIWSMMLFVQKKPDLGIVVFTLALLTKQNAVPLIPIVALALWLTRPPSRADAMSKNIVKAILGSAALFILFYLPLVPRGANMLTYPITTYIEAMGGQREQWQASVNALNYWYALKLNLAQDSNVMYEPFTIRQIGIALTALWTAIALVVGYRNRKDLYHAIFLAVVVISMGTFVFATRMHERHSYMMIAYLTFLIPYMRTIIPYLILSWISYYNLSAVWAQYFFTRWGDPTWDSLTKWLSVGTTGLVVAFPAWIKSLNVAEFLHQKRIKA